MERSDLRQLEEWLRQFEDGYVFNQAEVSRIADNLAGCWRRIEGGDSEEMTANKLGRIEQAEWHPPVLVFVIERHGGTALGSTRAELQSWRVNVREGRVEDVRQTGYRQLHPRAPAFRVEPVADEIARQVQAGGEADYLRWSQDRKTVKVTIRKILQRAEREQATASHYQQTSQGRSRRLREALRQRLEALGWQYKATNTFERQGGRSSMGAE